MQGLIFSKESYLFIAPFVALALRTSIELDQHFRFKEITDKPNSCEKSDEVSDIDRNFVYRDFHRYIAA